MQAPPTSPSRRRRSKLLGAALPALLVAAALAAACGDSDSSASKRDRPERADRVSAAQAADAPNVIFVYTDDQDLDSFKPRFMPRTFRTIADAGTRFENFVVATPLCCPSRATYVSGGYPHNDGVFSNRRGYSNLQQKFSTLQVWMKLAGYRTAWIGKYLQGYESGVEDPLQAPPGIEDWHATFAPRYYDYPMAVNGREVEYGSRSRDYYTTVVTEIATRLIGRQSERKRPLFMTLNHLAPHTGSGGRGRCEDVVPPAPRDEDLFRREPLPRGPSFNERDVSDKPPFVGERLSREKIERLELAHGCRLAALRGVDRSNAAIVQALKRGGELRNSVVIFTSDNGILQGEHRESGKNIPYEEGIRQPLAILAGREALGGAQAPLVDGLTANVDLAPTILDLAGAKPCIGPGECRELDGRSLVPSLRGRRGLPADREILIEGGKGGGDCLYAGIRTPGLSYLEHARERADGSCEREWAIELYDLDGELTGNPDPLQLENLASPAVPESRDPRVIAVRERLDRRLAALRRCAGADCR